MGRAVMPRSWLLATVVVSSLLGISSGVMPDQGAIRIDCGSNTTVTDPQGLSWSADSYYGPNGTANNIPTAYTQGGLLSPVDRTIRAWQTGDSCYRVPVAPGRYLVRLSFSYNNYDGNYFSLFPQNALPLVGVVINDVLVEQVAAGGYNSSAYYTDFVAFSSPNQDLEEFSGEGADGDSPTQHSIQVCLASVQGAPYINSLQVLPVDSEAYFAANTGTGVVLSTWRRIDCGSETVLGPENNGDLGYRTWSPDVPASATVDPWQAATTTNPITMPASYASLSLPQGLFQSARKAGPLFNSTGYNFTGIRPVDPTNQFMVVLYFAEIDDGVVAGQREMDVWVNGQTYTIDVAKAAGGAFTGLVVNVEVPLGGSPSDSLGQWLAVLLRPSGPAMLPPIISGIEVFEIVRSSQANATSSSTNGVQKYTNVRINCGGQYDYVEAGLQWTADQGYTSGEPSIVLFPGTTFSYSTSLRYFPHGRRNCYSVPVQTGRYAVRLYFNYGNYDLKNEVPLFWISAESTLVVGVQPSTPGGFQDLLVPVEDGEATICLHRHPSVPSPTLINSIEILQVNASSYRPDLTGSRVVLYNYFRVACGSAQPFGEDLTGTAADAGHRQWGADLASIPGLNRSCTPKCEMVPRPSAAPVLGLASGADSLPAALFASALEAPTSINYDFSEIEAGSTLLLVLYSVETSPASAPGARVFSVALDGAVIPGLEKVDLHTSPGLNTVFRVEHKFTLGPNSTAFSLALTALPGATLGPTISGLELYSVIPLNNQTLAATTSSLMLLKEALLAPEAVGWQGDPCQPAPWPGVQCVGTAGNATYDVVSISLPGLGMNGSIPSTISQLTQLTNLNLSSNTLQGPIPASLTTMPRLVSLDLSSNNLNDSIPAGFASMPSLHQLILSNNKLMGVPTGLVPPPAGLSVDLSGNPYLCGLGSLPDCNSIMLPPPPSNLTQVALGASSSGSSGAPVGAIVGGVLGGIALLLVALALLLFWRRRQQRVSESPLSPRKAMFEPRNPYAKTAVAMPFDVVPEVEGEGETSSGRHNYRY